MNWNDLKPGDVLLDKNARKLDWLIISSRPHELRRLNGGTAIVLSAVNLHDGRLVSETIVAGEDLSINDWNIVVAKGEIV